MPQTQVTTASNSGSDASQRFAGSNVSGIVTPLHFEHDGSGGGGGSVVGSAGTSGVGSGDVVVLSMQAKAKNENRTAQRRIDISLAPWLVRNERSQCTQLATRGTAGLDECSRIFDGRGPVRTLSDLFDHLCNSRESLKIRETATSRIFDERGCTLNRMTPSRLRVLVIEDHHDLAANLGDYLEAKGHVVDFAYDGTTGLARASTETFDVIILDLMLPGIDGLEVCRRLREDAKRDTPVLMLTARDTVVDRIAGLRSGSDDYVTKPFSLEEVELRLQALARRTHAQRTSALRVDDLELDEATRAVRRGGRDIELVPASFKILVELMRAHPGVVAREKLETILWGSEPPGPDALRSQIYLLRQAIDRGAARPLLVTVHGVGYRLGPP
jgi:DNA-binding response OmpR family regulator